MAVFLRSSSETAKVHVEDLHSNTKPPIRWKRQGKPKVKTGCITCKIRRVKCDETKPFCEKCRSTGRKCDGYTCAIHAPDYPVRGMGLARCHPQNLSNPLLDFPGTPMEHRYLDFFIGRTAFALSGSFESRFWKGLLPQVGHSEPTIQHAMMAVAALHERFEISGELIFDPSDDCENFALRQYNKAISCLTKRLKEGPQSEEVTLMCCVLFISLEYLRGNVTSAINHLRSGTDILVKWRENEGYFMDEAPSPRSHPDSISANLKEIFTRITVQSLLCGHSSTASLPKISEIIATNESTVIPTFFNDLHEARVMTDHLAKCALRFLCLAGHHFYLPDSPEKSALQQPRLRLLLNIERGSQSFRTMLASPTIDFSPEELRSTRIMRIQSIVCKIWLASGLIRDEMAFDKPQFEDLFREAITLASDACCDSRTEADSKRTQSLFSFDMGIIPTLYFVAIKCRIPSMRRTALGLLATTLPRREGLWDATIAGTVAARQIELEEKGLDTVGVICSSDPTGEKRPPESMRIVETIINRQDEVRCETAERRQKVTFVTIPNVKTGHWHMRKEILLWKREEQGWKPRHKVIESSSWIVPPYSSMLGHWVPGFFP